MTLRQQITLLGSCVFFFMVMNIIFFSMNDSPVYSMCNTTNVTESPEYHEHPMNDSPVYLMCNATNVTESPEYHEHQKLSLITHENTFTCLQKMKGPNAYKQFVVEMIQTCPVHNVHPLELTLESVESMKLEGMILEFGVFSGTSITKIADRFPTKTIHGFDSFVGLPEHWTRGDTETFSKGFFRVDALPSVPPNVILHKGWFHETIPYFISKYSMSQIAILHIDCDLYSSTKTIFNLLADYIAVGTHILFDELFNYPGYEDHELLALWEFLTQHKFQIEIIGKMGKAILCPDSDRGAQYQSVLVKIV